MQIEVKEISTLVNVVYELVKMGLQFSTRETDGKWVITLTGGY